MLNREQHLQHLLRLNEKIYRIQNFDKIRINEGKASVLLEAVDEADIDKLKNTVATFKKAVTDVSKQIDAAEKSIVSNDDVAKPAFETLKKYLTGNNEALTALEKATSNIDFESGMVASAIAGKISVPALVAVTTQQIASLESFLKSFENYKNKVVKSLVPLSKDDEKSLSSQKESNPKLPDIGKMQAYASEVFEKEKKGGFMSKVKSFFGGLFSKEAKTVASKFPKYDSKLLGDALATLLINVKVGTLKSMKVSKVPSAANVGDAAKAAKSSGKEKDKGGDQPGEGGGDQPGEGGGDQPGGGKAAPGKINPNTKKSLIKLKGEMDTETFIKYLKDQGVLSESRLLTNNRSKSEHEDEQVSRWSRLAGIYRD